MHVNYHIGSEIQRGGGGALNFIVSGSRFSHEIKIQPRVPQLSEVFRSQN